MGDALIRKTTRTQVIHGIEIPRADDSGWVFITRDVLVALAETERWDSQFGPAFVIHEPMGSALVAAGLAEKWNKGGYFRTDKLMELMNEWGW